ncbi:MAG: two-component regulator propeller domain-containing protein [Verrucomicrobiota bacterium]
MKPRPQARRLAAAWLGLCATAVAAAGGPRFHVDTWGAHDGLTANEVVAMIQTRDGYLWLGTLNGLFRFDGNEFKVFDEHNTPGLTSGRIVFLFEDSKTNLWIGTDSAGALLDQDGHITDLGFGKGSREGRLLSACEDSTGAVWLRSDDRQLRRYHDGKLDPPWSIGAGHTIIAEKSGRLWAGVGQGLVEMEPAAARQSMPPPTNQFPALASVDLLLPSRTGGFWCLGRDGAEDVIEKWTGGKMERGPAKYPWPEITAACEDREGNLIVGTEGDGVRWFDASGNATRISQNEGLSGNYVLSLHIDSAGSLWVGLDSGGLNRVQRQLFNQLSSWAGGTVQSVCQDNQGRLWFSSPKDGIDYLAQDGTCAQAPSRPPISLFNPRALLVDASQRIWAATFSGATFGAGLFCWNNGLFEPAPGMDAISPQVSALHQDRAGRLWAGTQRGLACWDGRAWRVYTTRDGLSADIVRAIADDADGALWIGTEGGGLNRLKEGHFTSYQKSNHFPSDNISALYSDRDGVLWIGTFGNGLIRFESGHWTNYTTDDGLDGNGVAYIIEDDQGCLWLGSNAGLMRVKKSALNDFAAGKLDFIPCHSYGERDGLPSSECTLGSQPAACRAADGTFWFPTIKGLVSIAPSQIQSQTNSLPVIIESVLVAGQPLTTNGPDSQPPRAVVVPAGKDSLDIQYTGLNLDDPQQPRFRYQMQGLETGTNEAGPRRTAHYPKLPPGSYLFEVSARNDDGTWNTAAASLAVTVLPAFWQTWTFRASTAAILLGIIIAFVYFISTQKLQRQLADFRQQQALEKDRARIARDIHDQVGASLTQLSLLGEMVESDKNNPAEVAACAGQISQTARETARALDEIVWTVNPSNDTLEGLISYLCKHAQEYLAVAGLRYRLEAPSQLPATDISPEARHNIFLAAKESVTNIVKHAQATEACIRLRLAPGSFILEIEDNGRGPAGHTGPAAQSRSGLRNMRKRMEDIGGNFEILPGAGGGTLVRLTAPIRQSPPSTGVS